jgi:hypothetical protein
VTSPYPRRVPAADQGVGLVFYGNFTHR